jgi:hypothetical protein
MSRPDKREGLDALGYLTDAMLGSHHDPVPVFRESPAPQVRRGGWLHAVKRWFLSKPAAREKKAVVVDIGSAPSRRTPVYASGIPKSGLPSGDISAFGQ